MSVVLQAPASVAASSTFKLPLTGNSFTVDSQGFVTVIQLLDIVALLQMGFTQLPGGRNNFSATADPSVGADSTVDYAPGSMWINTTASPARAWVCTDATASAAVWLQISTGALIATANSPSFAGLTLSGLLTHSSSTAVTGFSGGGQASATVLTKEVNNITTATASSSPYDSVKFQAAAAGDAVWVENSAGNPVQLFGNGSDTVNGFASGTGATLPVGFAGWAVCNAAGAWTIASLPTFTQPVAYNTNSATSGTTLTGANVSGGTVEVSLAMTGTMGGDANAQLPTVGNLVAAIPNAVAGMRYKLRIVNESSANHVWTVTTNTGWTLNGTMTIAQNASRAFYVTFTTLSAAVLQSVDA